MDWKFQSIAVVGSGAIGLYYGGRLASAGEDVRFLTRSDFEAVSRDGLQVESIHGDFRLPRVNAYQSPFEMGPVDLVIVAWKATSNGHLREVLTPLLHSNTQVLTLQNGLGNCESLAEIVGADRVLGAMCFVCINRVAPGVVSHSAGGSMSIGEWRPNQQGRAVELERRFKAANIPATAVESLEQAQWEKLVWNIPFNGLSVADGGVTTDYLLATPERERHLRALMAEVIAGGRALGLQLDDGLMDYHINRTRPMGPYRTSSMIDYVEGREVEVFPIWEEPLRRAREAGAVMPQTELLLKRIRERLDTRG